jgi:hypothetical protein
MIALLVTALACFDLLRPRVLLERMITRMLFYH